MAFAVSGSTDPEADPQPAEIRQGFGDNAVSGAAPAPVLERVTAADGVSLSVGEWGNPAGREILFIHGQAQSIVSFKRQTDGALARDFRLVAYDLRGHGLSDKPDDPACYQDGRRWADDVHAVIVAKRLRRPVLVGWSARRARVAPVSDALWRQRWPGQLPGNTADRRPELVAPRRRRITTTRHAILAVASRQTSHSCAPATRSSRTRTISPPAVAFTSWCRWRSATRSPGGD
jgi:pimeloyl-ACP methyl ester carboxylesterase